MRRKEVELEVVPVKEATFTKKLNDYDEGSGKQAGGLGLASYTSTLRSTERSTSKIARGPTFKASDAEETKRSIR